MNSLEWFENTSDQEIGDENEALDYYLQSNKIEVEIDGEKIDSNEMTSPVRIRKSKYVNIFSMYAITYEYLANNNLDFDISEKIKEHKEWGEYAVAILNGPEFLKRVKKTVEKHPIVDFHDKGAGLVDYVNKEQYHGETGAFKKFDEYSHQNEYRIALETNKKVRNENGAFRLKIGDISDIIKVIATKELENLIEIKTK